MQGFMLAASPQHSVVRSLAGFWKEAMEGGSTSEAAGCRRVAMGQSKNSFIALQRDSVQDFQLCALQQ